MIESGPALLLCAIYRYIFCARNNHLVNSVWTITEVLVDHPVTVNAGRKVGIGSNAGKWEAAKIVRLQQQNTDENSERPTSNIKWDAYKTVGRISAA